jgi:Ca-activated chloride channel family protein
VTHFANPHLLFALVALPVLAWLLARAERGRVAAAMRFAHPATLGKLMAPGPSWRPWAKAGFALLGVACLMAAAARPRFGMSLEETVGRGAEVMVLFDVSRSMLAGDVPPNRLDAAKVHVRELLREPRGDRIGLIAFAGQPAIKAPLTADRGFLREVLEDLDPRGVPRGGTRIGDAIRKALEFMPPVADRDQAIVLISDGEDHDSMPLEAARQAARRNVRIFTLVLGDPRTGARIPREDGTGARGYLLYEGREVWSKANETLLREIAATTGGVCLAVGGDGQLQGPTWNELLGSLQRGEVRQERRLRYAEQFQWFVAAGLLFLALDFVMPRHAPRRKEHRR